MSELFGTAIVEKRNILNELRSNNMTLQELRFFSIYLSKINPYDVSTRVVRFPLNDFVRIMGIGTDINIPHFRLTVRHILQQIVEVPNEGGVGYSAFQLFKRAKVEKDELDEWYVEFDAHDEALPLMFDFKNRYFKYELWNALRLKSSNQVRMYEILKQYETLGRRELSVKDLRALLGIAPDEYPRWNNFKTRVLDACQEALKQTTDICFTYERGKIGNGGKWLTIIFHIQKNTEYVDQLTLDEFIELQPEVVVNAEEVPLPDDPLHWIDVYGSDELANLAEACNYEFTRLQMERILAVLRRIDILPDEMTNDLRWGRVFYLQEKYIVLNAVADEKARRGEKPIDNRYAYLIGILETEAGR